MNLKKTLSLLLICLMCLGLTACGFIDDMGKDIYHGDESVDAYAFLTISTGESITLEAKTYTNEVWTAHATAIREPYDFYLEEGLTATIKFSCTACDYSETKENVHAPDAFFFECECVTGDEHPAMTECLAINFILGAPPAEEG